MCFGTCFSFQNHAALQVALYLDLVGCRNSECSDTPTSISIHKRPITSPIPVNDLDTASFADRNRKTGLGFHQKRRIRGNPSSIPSLPLPSPPLPLDEISTPLFLHPLPSPLPRRAFHPILPSPSLHELPILLPYPSDTLPSPSQDKLPTLLLSTRAT